MRSVTSVSVDLSAGHALRFWTQSRPRAPYPFDACQSDWSAAFDDAVLSATDAVLCVCVCVCMHAAALVLRGQDVCLRASLRRMAGPFALSAARGQADSPAFKPCVPRQTNHHTRPVLCVTGRLESHP
jgi:hypothetical protein